MGAEVSLVKPAWVAGNLTILRSAMDAVERAGRAAYLRDEEACGYLTGPADDELRVDAAVELENLANRYHQADPGGHPRTGREYFKVHALKFERAIEAARREGQPVKVFFHSHLDCGAYFSAEDAASMTMGEGQAPAHDLSYLVTAVDKGEVTDHKLFIWDETSKSFVLARFSVVPN
jgi:proteasome lid subunit RPN8/RPN11